MPTTSSRHPDDTTIRSQASCGTPERHAPSDDAMFRRTTGPRATATPQRARSTATAGWRSTAPSASPTRANRSTTSCRSALLGVLKAVERFDPDYGAAFATFAVPTIIGELRRHFRDTTWAVHVPRRAKDLQHTVKVAVDELGQILGRSPTVAEIAGHAGVRDEDVLDALEAARCYRNTPLETASDDARRRASTSPHWARTTAASTPSRPRRRSSSC